MSILKKHKWTEVLNKKGNIFYLKSEFNNKPAWYYLDVFPNKLILFKNRIGKESLELKDYGNILHSGWGAEPPKEIKDKMEN